MAASKAAYFLQADKHESRLPTDAEWQHLGKATFKFIKHFKDSAERHNATLKTGRVVDVSWAHEMDDFRRRNHVFYPTGANAHMLHRSVNLEVFALIRELVSDRLPELATLDIINPDDYDNDASPRHIRDDHGNIIERMPLVAIALRMIADLGFQGASIVNGQLRQQCDNVKLPQKATQDAITGFKTTLQSIADEFQAATWHPGGTQVINVQSEHVNTLTSQLLNSPNPLNLDIQDFVSKNEHQTQLTGIIYALKVWAQAKVLKIMARPNAKLTAYMVNGGGNSGNGGGCPIHPHAPHTKEECYKLKYLNKQGAAKGKFKPPYARPTSTFDPSGKYKGKNFDATKTAMYQALAAIVNGAPPSINGAAASTNGAAASGNVTGSPQITAHSITLNDQEQQVITALKAGTFNAFAVTIDDEPNADERKHIQAEPYKQKQLQPAELSLEGQNAFQHTINELDLSQPPPLTKEFKALMHMEVNLSTESSDSSGNMPGLIMSSSDEEDDADDKSDTNMVHA